MAETVSTPLHFTRYGMTAVCGANAHSASPLKLAFDEEDQRIDCPLCRMYVAGMLAERRAHRG